MYRYMQLNETMVPALILLATRSYDIIDYRSVTDDVLSSDAVCRAADWSDFTYRIA